MATFSRTSTFSHHLGSGGRLSFRGVAGSLRIVGGAGEEATVRVAYRVQAADAAAAEREFEAAELRVERTEAGLTIESPERHSGGLLGLGWLLSGRGGTDVEIDLPGGAEVRAETVSGPISGRELVGEQHFRTVSGDVTLEGAAGRMEISTVSGSVRLDASGSVEVQVSTVSGDVRARAGRFERLRLSTTSGKMAVTGDLAAGVGHIVESISGDLDLATRTGLAAELRTLSGSIRSQLEHRLDGGRGLWRASLGDRSAALRFDSTSGSLRLLAPPPAAPDVPLAASPASAASEAVPPAAPGEGEGRPLGEGGPRDEGGPLGDDPELAILRALERGEIGVDDAAARLARR